MYIATKQVKMKKKGRQRTCKKEQKEEEEKCQEEVKALEYKKGKVAIEEKVAAVKRKWKHKE